MEDVGEYHANLKELCCDSSYLKTFQAITLATNVNSIIHKNIIDNGLVQKRNTMEENLVPKTTIFYIDEDHDHAILLKKSLFTCSYENHY